MTQTSLLALHQSLCSSAQELMKRKNADYARSAEGDVKDPLANFRLAETLGLCSTPAGILVRMTDKLRRLASLARPGATAAVDESINDTVLDFINYSVLFAAAWQEKAPQPLLTIPAPAVLPRPPAFGYRDNGENL